MTKKLSKKSSKNSKLNMNMNWKIGNRKTKDKRTRKFKNSKKNSRGNFLCKTSLNFITIFLEHNNAQKIKSGHKMHKFLFQKLSSELTKETRILTTEDRLSNQTAKPNQEWMTVKRCLPEIHWEQYHWSVNFIKTNCKISAITKDSQQNLTFR